MTKAVLRVCSTKAYLKKQEKTLHLEVLEKEQMKTKGNEDLLERRKYKYKKGQ